MRVDELLVKRGFYSTRQKAKEAIKRGEVFVNGRRVKKYSEDVGFSAKIEVFGGERPKGYWKLKELNEKWNFIKKGKVLDLGSSAGGFLLYAKEIVDFVLGIEYSDEFRDELKRIEKENKNVKVIFGDVFKLDLDIIHEYGKFDVILDDLTVDPKSSYKALKRFLPSLKENGFVLFIAKTGLDDTLPKFDLRIIRSEKAKDRDEIYFLLGDKLASKPELK